MVFNAQLSQSQEIRFLMCLRARVLGSVAGNQAICELFFVTVYLFVFLCLTEASLPVDYLLQILFLLELEIVVVYTICADFSIGVFFFFFFC